MPCNLGEVQKAFVETEMNLEKKILSGTAFDPAMFQSIFLGFIYFTLFNPQNHLMMHILISLYTGGNWDSWNLNNVP